MSLFDELNDSFESEVTVVLDSSAIDESTKILQDTEPRALSESLYQDNMGATVRTNSMSRRGNPYLRSASPGTNKDLRFALSDYSGSEWGDPADDSDPDGRFDALDEAIENFVDCISSEFDSAYESQDDDNLTFNDSTVTTLQSPSSILRLMDEMQNLPSQMLLETALRKYANLHEHMTITTSCHTALLRDLMQTAGRVGQQLATSTLDNQELTQLIADLTAVLPDIDFYVGDEIATIERETHNLITDLVGLNDSLHEMKQTIVIAQRLLRSTQNMVVVWQKEIDDVSAANEWLMTRQCEDKLASRSTAHELSSIRAGFDEVCSTMRETVARGLEERRILI